MDAAFFLVVDSDSKADLETRRREEFGSNIDDVDNDGGMRRSNLPADAFIARTIVLCVCTAFGGIGACACIVC